MLFGNSLEFFKVTLASPSSIQCFTRKIMMFHMHDLQLVELDCRHRVTPAASPHTGTAQAKATGDCLGPSWSALVSACLLNLSTSLKVISNLASLLFCSFGELLNETLDLCLHYLFYISCLLSAPIPINSSRADLCLICHTHSDTGVAPAKHLETFNCSRV